VRFTITAKKFQIEDKDYQYIERVVKKLLKLFPGKDPDYPLFDIVIRKHKKKSFDHAEKRLISQGLAQPLHGHENIDNPIYYDGTLDFILPKKRLITKMLGKTVREAIKDGFDELFIELDKYKGLHFKDDSEYFDHRTIRKEEE